MQDLDPFNLASKALVLCPQPLIVQEVPDFPDSSQVPVDNTFDDWDSDPNEPELNFNLHEGLAGKVVNEEIIDLDLVPQRRSSAERRDLANLGSWKGKKRLPRSLDASFDVGTALASPNTQSKDKEGPSTAKMGREGTGRKDKERATLEGPMQSRRSDIKEHVRKHLKWEKEKKKEPPSQSAVYLEAIKQAQEVVYKEYVGSFPFTNNFEKKLSQLPTSEDGKVAFFVQPNVDATNRGSLVFRDLVVDSRAKGI